LLFFICFSSFLQNDEALSCPLLQDQSTGKFNVPTNQQIDKQLIVGSAVFGLGWGIAGLCPVSKNINFISEISVKCY
jgi:uncharacterized membrane protein YedE/YeeE